MDFPFEYVERVCKYPSFDANSRKDKNERIRRKKAIEYPESEEHEVDKCATQFCADLEDKKLRKTIDVLKGAVKKKFGIANRQVIRDVRQETNETLPRDVEVCTSSEESLSVGQTSSDGIDRVFKEDARGRAVVKRFRIMQKCACTDSACDSASSNLTEESSESTSSSDCEDVTLSEEPEIMPKKKETKSKLLSSDETESSSDDNWGIEEEIQYLEAILKEKEEKKGAPNKIGKTDDSKHMELDEDKGNDEEDSEEEMNEARMLAEKKSLDCVKKSREISSSPINSKTDSRSTRSNSNSNSSSRSLSPVLFSSATCPSSENDFEEKMKKTNLEKFCWNSDDLYASTDTDVDFERSIDWLDSAISMCKKVFDDFKMPDTSRVEIEKLKNFAPLLPTTLKTQTEYTVLEEPADSKEVGVIQNNHWMVRQLDSGKICSARIASRKYASDLKLQKGMRNDILVLRELLPELSDPSHIARLIDVGYSADFKYLIFEELGTDLYSLASEFREKFDPVTKFLLSYFTFSAIKELHSLGFVHLHIRPACFSVNHQPFNVKIKDFGNAMRKVDGMRTPEEVHADMFSPRVFHKECAPFDEFVDYESWIFTMIAVTGWDLPWTAKQETMWEEKEKLFNEAFDLDTDIFQGCSDGVAVAARSIGESTLSYKDFMSRMNLIFSVEVMQYSDSDQPHLWSFRELSAPRQHFGAKPGLQWDEDHWNPADELDSYDEEKFEKIRVKAEEDLEKISESVNEAENKQLGLKASSESLEYENDEPSQQPSATIGSQELSRNSAEVLNDDKTRKAQRPRSLLLREEMSTAQSSPTAPLTPSPSKSGSLTTRKASRSPSDTTMLTSANSLSISKTHDSNANSGSSSQSASTESHFSTWTSSDESCEGVPRLWDSIQYRRLPEKYQTCDAIEKKDLKIYRKLLELNKNCAPSSSESETKQLNSNSEETFDEDDEKEREGDTLINLVEWKQKMHRENLIRRRPKFLRRPEDEKAMDENKSPPRDRESVQEGMGKEKKSNRKTKKKDKKRGKN
uniref:Protein kinase domain-containing protein n=1 Tax=Caenorhabditis japonica TaxID=281687 RepID=A0A8R1DJC5_CAEJA